MIKRPLIWILVSYITGILLAEKHIVLATYLAFILFILILFFLLIKKVSNQYFNTLDKFLIILPAIMFIGLLNMKAHLEIPKINKYYDDKVQGYITGTLYQIEKKNDQLILYLKNNKISVATDENSNSNSDYNGNKSSDENINENSEEIQDNQLGDKQSLTNPKNFTCKRIIVYISTVNSSLRIGNRIKVYGQIKLLQHNTNPGQFDEYQYYKTQGIDYKVFANNMMILKNTYSFYHQFLYKVNNKITDSFYNILNRKEAGILSAMLLADKSGLDSDINELYQENGISHILAISGLNVSLIGIFIYKILRKLQVRLSISIIFSILFIYSFGALTNFGVSTNRAVVMLIVSYIAILLGRTYDLGTALSLSAFIILIQNPMEFYSVGFLLSFGAVVGIAAIVPTLKEIYINEDVSIIEEQNEKTVIRVFYILINKLKEAILLSLGISLVTTPVILYFFYEFSTYSIIINLIILPFSSLLLFIAFLGGIVGCFSTAFGTFFIGGAHYILVFYEFLCRSFSKLPFHTILVGQPKISTIIIYYAILFLIIPIYRFRFFVRKDMEQNVNKSYLFSKSLSVILILSMLILFIPHHYNGLSISFLDVGQGDGIVMRMPNGNTYLIDGGSSSVSSVGKYRIEQYLKCMGLRRIHYAVVTHADSDHVSGLKEMLEDGEIKIEHLVLPITNLVDDAYLELIGLAKQNQVPILYIKSGDYIKEGKVTITCLHPEESYEAKSRNAYSTVLSLNYKSFDMLLTGDIEEDGENEMISSNMLKDYDVLKVAHHGSRYSTCEAFLDRVKPEISIISCGKNNKYRHPHEELINRIQQIGSQIYKTTDVGAITIETDGEDMKLSGYKEK